MPATKPSRRAAGTSSVPLVSLAFGSDGHTLATTDDSGLATLWKTGESWSPVRTLEFEGSAKVVAFARDGRHLAIGGDLRGVALFDLGHPDREQPRQIPFPSLSQLAISPDGQTAAMSSYESHEIILWDLALGRERLTLKGHSATVMHLAFTADGRSLASATGSIVDRPIRVWNVATGRLQRRIGGHAAALQALAFSPDGQLVAGACPHERAIRIWHVGTAGEVAVIDAHSQSTRSIAFSPDGRLMATGAGDGTAALWSVATATEIVPPRLRSRRGQERRLFARWPDIGGDGQRWRHPGLGLERTDRNPSRRRDHRSWDVTVMPRPTNLEECFRLPTRMGGETVSPPGNRAR